MKRLLALFAALTLFLTPSALGEATPASAPCPEPETVLSAIGSAKVMLTPDVAVLTLGVRAAGDTMAEAQRMADETFGRVREALLGQGIAAEDVHITYYNVETVYSYQYSKLGDQETPSGFTAETDLAVYVRDVGKVGAVVDAAIGVGADSRYELTFESSERAEAYETALAAAAKDAMRKAGLLARAGGLTLIKLKSVCELTDGEAEEVVVSVTAGSEEGLPLHNALTVTATVEVCYQAE